MLSLDYISEQLNLCGLSNNPVKSKNGLTFDYYILQTKKIYSSAQIKIALDKLQNALNLKVFRESCSIENCIAICIEQQKRKFPSYYDYGGWIEENKVGSILFGLNGLGKPIIYNIQETKSLLIAGTSGSGKSVALNSYIESLLVHADSEQLELNLIDLKRTELTIFCGFKGVKKIATTYDGAIGILEDNLKEINRRYVYLQKRKKRQATVDDFPIRIIVIDEYAMLSSINQKEVDSLVSQICAIGRASNVYMIIATQTPTNKVISNLVRSNIQSRVGLRTTNVSQSVAILQTRDCVDLLGKGDAYLSIDGVNGLQRCQVCNIEANEILNFVEEKEKKEKSFIVKWLEKLMKK